MHNRLFSPLMDAAGEGTGGSDGKPDLAAQIAAAMSTIIAENNKSLLLEMRKDLNGISKQFKKAEGQTKTEETTTETTTEKTGQEGQTKPADAALTRQLAKLTADLEAEKKARQEEAIKRINQERDITLGSELDKAVTAAGGYSKETARSLVFDSIRKQVTYDEDGNMVVPGNLDLGEFLKTKLTTDYDFAIAPKMANGTGARNGKPGSQTVFDIDKIGPNMTPEDRKAYYAHTAEMAKQAQGQ